MCGRGRALACRGAAVPHARHYAVPSMHACIHDACILAHFTAKYVDAHQYARACAWSSLTRRPSIASLLCGCSLLESDVGEREVGGDSLVVDGAESGSGFFHIPARSDVAPETYNSLGQNNSRVHSTYHWRSD